MSTQEFYVTVSFGANSQDFDVPAGSTVEAILNNGLIQETIGFKGGKDETYTVNGNPASFDYVLQAKDHIEVIKNAGEKA